MDDQETYSELLEIQRDLQELIESRGWARLMQIAEGQTTSRQSMVMLQPLTGSNGVYAQEFAKGEVSGITLFMRLPEDVLEQTVSDLERMREESTEEEDD